MSLNNDVAAAVDRWRGLKERCPPSPRSPHKRDCMCSGTGYVQPASVMALIEAVLRPERICRERYHSWEEIGEGALEGVLRHWEDVNLDVTVGITIPGFQVEYLIGDATALAAVDWAVMQMWGKERHE